MGSLQGQQATIPTPAQPDRRSGSGAVDDPTGEAGVQVRRRKRREEVAQWPGARPATHPTGPVDVARDTASRREDDAGEAVVRAAAGRPVRLDLPTDSPRLNPIAMLRRHCRREGTHRERFERVTARLLAAADCFARSNRAPQQTLSIIGSNAVQAV